MNPCTAVARFFAASILMAFVGSACGQQDYPNKLIHVITPYPPGGSTTPLAHFFGQGMTSFYNNAEQLAALLLAEQARYANIIKAANIAFEN